MRIRRLRNRRNSAFLPFFLWLVLSGIAEGVPFPCPDSTAPFAAAVCADPAVPSEGGFLRSVWEDQKRIWKAPFTGETWRRPAPYWIIGLGTGSFLMDDAPSRRLREDASWDDLDRIFASTPGDVVLTVYPLAAWSLGHLLDRPGLERYGAKATRAAVGGIAVALLLKAVTQRSRPHNDQVYGFWEGGNSFPSGHAAVAWSVAAATVRHFDEHRWVPWVAYPLAGLVSFTRITSGNHFASDVVVGSTLGFAVGRYVGGH
ncbi:MAG: hypothetical protein Kow00109_12490 [Acidobacteriota bacterium]